MERFLQSFVISHLLFLAVSLQYPKGVNKKNQAYFFNWFVNLLCILVLQDLMHDLSGLINLSLDYY